MRSPGTPIRAAQVRVASPCAKKQSSRGAAAAASASCARRGQVMALCSLAMTGTPGGAARAAAHHAPNM